MDNLKSAGITIIALALVGGAGYFAVTSLQSGSEYVNVKKIRELETENRALKEESEQLKSQIALMNTEKTNVTPPPEQPKEPAKAPVKTETKPKTTTYKNQTLINELQAAANKGTVLKLKSAGPTVGSVQKFLNLYFKTKNKIDNDYGASTKTVVSKFQKDQGLTASGETGKSTFLKMVAWLKKQG